MLRLLFALLALTLVQPARAADDPDGPAILALATRAHGGDSWAKARTLYLEGWAEFWGDSGAAPKSRYDRYVMYRVFDPNRAAAHGAEGRIRIIGEVKGRQLFTVGYDGATTWTDKGITPKAQADEFWANNMGFGIIRHALKPGFKAERLADGALGPDALWMVRLTDPTGGVTLFGIDQKSHAVRTMGFTSPRGWHERHYSGYYRLKGRDWLQPATVSLYYNGVKANTIHWTKAVVDGPIDERLFAPPFP